MPPHQLSLSVPSLKHLSTRLLRTNERPYPAGNSDLPLVVEPDHQSDVAASVAAIESQRDPIGEALSRFGAILFRGFGVHSPLKFEQLIQATARLQPMSGYFMAEPGRTIMKGSQFVFHTSTALSTGGAFQPPCGYPHSENYYTLDTPRFVSFWCARSSWKGGETALFHSARAYQSLTADVRCRLTAEHVCTPKAWPISMIAQTYGLPEIDVELLAGESGLDVIDFDGHRYAVLRKPSLYIYNRDEEITLAVNLSQECPALQSQLETRFAEYYQGREWVLHRLSWRFPRIGRQLQTVENLPRRVRFRFMIGGQSTKRHTLWLQTRGSSDRTRLSRKALPSRRLSQLPDAHRLMDLLNDEDVHQLSTAVWDQRSVFSWRSGDVLVLDNLQVLHAGLPGIGRRELGVILCDVIPVETASSDQPLRALLGQRGTTLDYKLRHAAADRRRTPQET